MAKFEERAVRYVADLIRDFKLEDFQAAGWPGNFGVETGGFEHVQEIAPLGGGRGGLGDAQWTGPRRRVFEAWIERHPGWTAADYDANYSMLFRELVGDESAALEAVRTAHDVDGATEIVMRRYERPGVEHLERRKEYGRRALAAFRASGLDVATLKAMPRPGGVAVVEPVQEVLPPRAKLEPNNLAPVLIALLSALLKGQQPGGGQPGSQPGQPDLLSLLLPLLTGLPGGQPLQLPPPVIEQPKPASVTPKPATSWLDPTSVALGGTSFFAGLIAQLNGNIAPPIGETATLPGILTTVLPIAATFLGGPIGGLVSRLFGSFTITRKS